MDTKARHLLSQIFAGIISAIIIISLFLFPNLLHKDTDLIPMEFITAVQLGDRDTTYLQGSFRQEVPEYEILWLYAENAEITINIGNQSFRYNGRGSTSKIFRSPGSGWFSFSSSGIAVGEPVEFVIHSYYGESNRAAASLLTNLHMGDGEGLHKLLLQKINFFGVVVLFAVIAGVIFLMEGTIDILFGLTADGTRITLFGFFCFSGGLWCVTDMLYPYFTLIISPPWAAAFLDMVPVLMFPISLALMIRYYIQGKRTRCVMNVILLIEILLAVVCLSLQIMGQIDLIEQQIFMGIVAIPSIGFAIVCIVLELKKYKDNYLVLLFFTVLPVFISNIIDGINILYPFMPRRTLMQYSFAVSALILTFQLVSYAKAEVGKAEAMGRMEKELMNSRISVMLSQIQPHFLYNSLQGIKQLCDVEPKKASEALEHFAYYLRGNLDSLMDVQLIPFGKELEHIKDYLYLESMRFNQKLNIQLHIIHQDFLLPPLTVQPIIENAIRHGLNKKKGGGTLTVRCERMGENVVITIHDDGVGFDLAEKKIDNRSHIGIENTRNRLEKLCGGMLLIESEKGVGTTVKMIIPRKETTE